MAGASVLDGAGTALATIDGRSDILSFTLTVPSAQDFYLRIEGGQSTSVQYSASYTRLGATGLQTVVNTEASHTLAPTELHLVMAGRRNIDGTGNAHNNALVGNEGNNTLKGLGGSDRLSGNGGNDLLDGGRGEDRLQGNAGGDTYFVDNRNDLVFETAREGTDRVLASDHFELPRAVEYLVLTGGRDIDASGNAADKLIAGNRGDNLVEGLGGDDILTGGRGADLLAGGRGDDIFVFLTVADSASRHRDRIADFREGDLISLSDIDADTGRRGEQSFDFIRGRFHGEAGELRLAGRSLLGDVDGDGRADLAIDLPRGTSISGGDLLL